MRKRITWIDMAKGYGSLLVIYGHIDRYSVLGEWLYTFHVPLFFILSGYMFNGECNFNEFFRKKVKSMIIPYICLGIPMVSFWAIGEVISGKLNWKGGVFTVIRFVFVQNRIWTLWFLACLFLLNILFYFAVKYIKKDIFLAIFAIILAILGLMYYELGGQPLVWNADVCLTAFPFFFIGYMLRKNPDVLNKISGKTRSSILWFIACLTVNIVCSYCSYRISGKGLDMYESSYGVPLLVYIAAVTGTMCVIILARWFDIGIVRYIGQNSIIYFAWHQTIAIPIVAGLFSLVGFVLPSNAGMLITCIYTILQIVVICVLITICNEIILKSQFRFILGK